MKAPQTTGIMYTACKVGQLLSLLTLGLGTVVTWIVEVYLALELSLESDRKYAGFTNPDNVNEYISALTNVAPSIVLKWAVISTFLTVVLLSFKRVRAYGKSYIVSSAVFIAFCFAATALSHQIIRTHLAQIVGI